MVLMGKDLGHYKGRITGNQGGSSSSTLGGRWFVLAPDNRLWRFVYRAVAYPDSACQVLAAEPEDNIRDGGGRDSSTPEIGQWAEAQDKISSDGHTLLDEVPGEELRRGAIFTVRLLTAEQVAEITGESKKTVWKRVARGELPHLKIGRLDRFSLEEINAWLEQMGPKPGTQKTGVFPGIKDMRELTPSQTREDYHG